MVAYLVGAVVYMLSHLLFDNGTLDVTLLILHYIVPIGMVLDWLLFDVDALGAGSVALYIIAMQDAFVALCYVYLAIDHALAKRAE